MADDNTAKGQQPARDSPNRNAIRHMGWMPKTNTPAENFQKAEIANLERLRRSQLAKEIDSIQDQSRDSSPSFTIFPTMPKELRIMIWKEALKEALLGRRILFCEAINTGQGGIIEEEDNGGRSDGGAGRPATHSPALLFVCHESREVAFEFYRLLFGGSEILPEAWINFDNDILLLDFGLGEGRGMQYMPEEIRKEDRQMVQHLGVILPDSFPAEVLELIGGDGNDEGPSRSEQWLGFVLAAFPNVKDLYVVDWGNIHTPENKSSLGFIKSTDLNAGLHYFSDESMMDLDGALKNVLLKQASHRERYKIDSYSVLECCWNWDDSTDMRRRTKISNCTTATPLYIQEFELAKLKFEVTLLDSEQRRAWRYLEIYQDYGHIDRM